MIENVKTTDNFEQETYFLKVETLLGNLPQVAVAVPVLPTVVAMIFDLTIVWVWASLFWFIGGFLCFRSFLAGKQFEAERTEKLANTAVRRWSFQTLFFACLWAILPWVPDKLAGEQLLIFGLILSGTTAGNLLANATFPRLGGLYLFISLNSFLACLAYQDFYQNIPIIVVVSLYVILVSRIQHRLSFFFERNFQLIQDLEMANKAKAKSQKMAIATSRLAAQAEMTASLTHEIANPLTILKAKLELAKKRQSTQVLSTEMVNELIEKCLKTVDRIEKIIRSTKDYFYQNEQSLRSETFNLNRGLEDLFSIFKAKCSKRNVQFRKEQLNFSVYASETLVKQVISNLLNNAYDAVKQQEKARVQISARIEGRDVVVRVHNSGPTIDPQVAERIFEPFFTTKGKGIGLGLGLSISASLAKEMKGDLWLETENGTCFCLALPVADNDQAQSAS